ncbi:uncharacterized protein C2orf81 homolog isoform X2 [Vidua chalybeata]|uniref:uncharacterized protein C2orf81 homolog isoform X2 n=1 Tax=Vidua chalybeata TaxID=81927 RepID=UPI0023A8CA24|nr:uncharacterized protein C2orf81 homolog isoform X2 [Vidua chalybeata]
MEPRDAKGGGMAEKAKPLGAGTRSKKDKSHTASRAQPRQSKKVSLETQPTPAPDAASLPREPLDVGPILDELLERVLTECTLAAVARQLVPFTVARARDAILFVAEWRFLVRDDGDPEPEGDPDPERDRVWKEDEEPQTFWDTWTDSIPEASLSSEEVPVAAEAESPLVCPGEVPALDVPLPPEQLPGAVIVPGPGPPLPEPPIAPQPPGKGRRLSAAPGRGRRPSRPPRPRPAPLDAPRPPAPLPAAPSEPAAQAPPESREVPVADGDQVPPSSSSSRRSLASIRPRRPSRGTGVPRMGVRRGAARWVLPEVKVVDASNDPERARSLTRLPAPATLQVLSAAARATKAEPQLCDPWLASVRLAPGVTVRWGGNERRGPAPAGHGGDEQGDEALRRAEKDLKPILPYPECRLSEYGESEEELEKALGTRQLPGLLLPGALPAPGRRLSPRVSPVPGLAPGMALYDALGARGSSPALLKRAEVNKKTLK